MSDPIVEPFTDVVQRLARSLELDVGHARPGSTALPSVIYGNELTQRELLFQARRLQETEGVTESEKAHLADLMSGYIVAAHYVGILKRYLQGRLDRRGTPTTRLPEQQDPFEPVTDERG